MTQQDDGEHSSELWQSVNVSPHEIELNINYYVDRYNISWACFKSQSRCHTKVVSTRMSTGSTVTPVTLSIIGSMSMLAW